MTITPGQFDNSRSFGGPGFAALLLIAAVAMALRLYGITAIGVGGSDTILYYALAEQWMQGNRVFQIGDSAMVFRPVLLALNALALQLFAHSDAALKLAGVLFDSANLVLLAVLAWQVSLRRVVVLASALTYALLPLAVWASRQELPHTYSTFFILATCVLLVRSLTTTNVAYGRTSGLLAGTCLGLAALTHEELVLLGLPLVLFLFFAHAPGGVVPVLRERFLRVAVFGIVPVCVVAVILLGEYAAVQAAVGSSTQAAGADVGSWLAKFPRFIWDAVVGSTSATMAIALLLCACFLVWRAQSQSGNNGVAFGQWAGFCLVLPIAHIVVYAFFFNTLFSRAFLPLVPLLIIALYMCLSDAMARVPQVRAVLLTSLVLVILTASNFASYSAFNVGNRRFAATWAEPVWPTPTGLRSGVQEFLVDARYVQSYATYWRSLHDVLAAAVDVDNKILLLPSTAMYSPGRRALQLQVYFGDNLVYRVDHVEQSLAEVVRDHNIKWVVFSTAQQRREPTRMRPYRYNGVWGPASPVDLAGAYGMERYSAQGEYEMLLAFLAEVDAVEESPFPAGSYAHRVTRLFRLH